MRSIKLQRVSRPAVRGYGVEEQRGGLYRTPDGRFSIERQWSRCGDYWQCRALDGSKPFRGYGKNKSGIYNGDTLRDVKELLADIYDAEQED